MNEGIPISRTEIADAVGLHIQELHASGRLRGAQPLLRIDNREQAKNAPYQFDAAKGLLHRADCKTIPAQSKSTLYGVWQVAKEDEALACPLCNPMLKSEEKSAPKAEAKPADTDTPIDLFYGLLSVISQFGGVLRERGQEYRNSKAGNFLGAQIEKVYSGVNQRERDILDVLASSLGNLAVSLREFDDGLNTGSGQNDGADPAKHAAGPGPDQAP